MFCKYCGCANDDAAVYCVKCGKTIGVAAAEEESAAPAEKISVETSEKAPAAEQTAPPASAKAEKPAKRNKKSKKNKAAPTDAAEQPLKKFKKALAVFSFILALLSFNWISNILSLIALLQSPKYKNAVTAKNHRTATRAAKSAKALSIISVILSLLTIAAAAGFVWWAMRYTKLGLLF